MVNNIVPIPGYVHLYRSMLRFYDMPSAELKEMLYLLNTANLDSYGFHHPEAHVVESGPVAFCGWLDHRYARPYFPAGSPSNAPVRDLQPGIPLL